jgi:hypothetical protein
MYTHTPFSETLACVDGVAKKSSPILMGGALGLAFEVVNGSGVPFSDFKVEAQDHDDGEWYTYATGADAVGGNVLFVSATTPDILAAGDKSHMHLRCVTKKVRFSVTLDGGDGPVTIRGGKVGV